MANIFFIHRFPFNKEAFIRDEFEYFICKGFNVKYLDISHLLKKRKFETDYPQSLKKHVISFENKKVFNDFLFENNKKSLIVTDVGLLSNSAWMYLVIFKSRIPYVLFENAVLPKIKVNTKVESNKVGLLKLFKRFNYKKLFQKPIEIVQFYKAMIAVKSAEMIITSKPKLSAEKRPLLGKNTLIKYSMSLDYRVAKNVSDELIVEKPYAVFIDQYFCHHPDFKTNHIVHFFTAEEYYKELNIFLNNFSKETGLKIVIASHPRRNEENKKDFNSSFVLYYNKTAELIKNAKIVLLHFSTALNYAIIFNKPFLLLNSSLFKNSSVYEHVMMFSSYFQKEPVNMDNIEDCVFGKELYSIDSLKYENYLKNYIKHPKASDESFRNLVEIVLEALKMF